MNVVYIILLLTLWCNNVVSTTLEVTRLNIFGANLRDGNPLPQFVDMTVKARTIDSLDLTCPDDIWENLINQSYPKLPYLVLDNYDRDGGDMKTKINLPVVVQESTRLKAIYSLNQGGKMLSLFDKKLNKEILFRNPVFQPANLGRLNAWTSGGVEWNWPRLGHSVFTSKPIFAGKLKTKYGEVLRIYEFDREMNSTWQVDTLLVDSSNNEIKSCEDVVWIHVKVRNTNPDKISAYWWTNVGVQLQNKTKNRVILPADYAIISGAKLTKVPFPLFDENKIDTCGTFGPGILDHSYPSNYYNAHENFIRSETKTDRSWMSLHHGDGFGMLHSQTKELDGRKYWVWGNDIHDVARMDFLSSPGHGHYIEMQAGVAPTQSQTFTLEGEDTLEWTETISALQIDPEKVEGSYDDALKVVNETVEENCNIKTFMDMNTFFSEIADMEVEEVLYNGSGWGALHEQMIGKVLSPGLQFNKVEVDNDLTRPWYELLSVQGTFSNLSLSVPPSSFQVDIAWVDILHKSIEAKGETWLHYLHLGIAAHHRSDYESAKELYTNAIRLNPNSIHALRGMALMSLNSNDPQNAWKYYNKAWLSISNKFINHNNNDIKQRLKISLAREIIAFGISQPRSIISLNVLASFVNNNILISEELKNDAQLEIAIAYINLYAHNDFNGVLEYLKKSNVAATSNLTPVMLELWQEAQWMKKSDSEGGKVLTLLEKVNVSREFPPPLNIDFRGAT